MLGAVLALGACNACQNPAPVAPPDTRVYLTLVEAGCLAASDGGVAAVAAEHAAPNPAWLQCLYDGGTVQSCGVPCGGAGGSP